MGALLMGRQSDRVSGEKYAHPNPQTQPRASLVGTFDGRNSEVLDAKGKDVNKSPRDRLFGGSMACYNDDPTNLNRFQFQPRWEMTAKIAWLISCLP